MIHSLAVKAGFDASSLGILYAWWIGIAPAIATTLTIAWVTYSFAEVVYRTYKKYK